ncbi:hypothetical protein JRQ81_003436 [Phrynocephalus forsythii]|uniref:C-type lectin domain-containing protein n=1 Tax=Phrynocephalus forsythii TaxID=171643 RepID=A0A9Q0XJW6_9SAUR|nr:hypothetical protein JRQ81_003436 [Phrynocephalus forsythii]
MEDEEGYMALNIRPRIQHGQNPQNQNPELVRSNHAEHRLNSEHQERSLQVSVYLQYKEFLRLQVFQLRYNLVDSPKKELACQRFSNNREDTSKLENITKLRTFFCKLHNNSSSECRLCPENWRRQKNRCYWISKEKQTWHKSQEDCREKNAEMLMIQSLEEQTFIVKMISERKPFLWLGIKTPSSGGEWSWIDGSPLNGSLLQSSGSAEPNSCGMLKNNLIISQACGAMAEWICETEALLV